MPVRFILAGWLALLLAGCSNTIIIQYEQWSVAEIRLQASNSYNNPYTGDLFTAPDNKSPRVFMAGKKE